MIPRKRLVRVAEGPGIFAPGYPKSEAIACSSTALTDGVEETYTSGASGLQYDAAADRYVYVWKTDKPWRGCRQLVLKLTDGSTHRANFDFR